ncbi:hypothetical protein F4677DRAFT_439735 [Hypoxylon crocopeplum]|nr:hypothetical protein F4677DRAFT_439735 [Hypoxylon crocopeplum]
MGNCLSACTGRRRRGVDPNSISLPILTHGSGHIVGGGVLSNVVGEAAPPPIDNNPPHALDIVLDAGPPVHRTGPPDPDVDIPPVMDLPPGITLHSGGSLSPGNRHARLVPNNGGPSSNDEIRPIEDDTLTEEQYHGAEVQVAQSTPIVQAGPARLVTTKSSQNLRGGPSASKTVPFHRPFAPRAPGEQPVIHTTITASHQRPNYTSGDPVAEYVKRDNGIVRSASQVWGYRCDELRNYYKHVEEIESQQPGWQLRGGAVCGHFRGKSMSSSHLLSAPHPDGRDNPIKRFGSAVFAPTGSRATSSAYPDSTRGIRGSKSLGYMRSFNLFGRSSRSATPDQVSPLTPTSFDGSPFAVSPMTPKSFGDLGGTEGPIQHHQHGIGPKGFPDTYYPEGPIGIAIPLGHRAPFQQLGTYGQHSNAYGQHSDAYGQHDYASHSVSPRRGGPSGLGGHHGSGHSVHGSPHRHTQPDAGGLSHLAGAFGRGGVPQYDDASYRGDHSGPDGPSHHVDASHRGGHSSSGSPSHHAGPSGRGGVPQHGGAPHHDDGPRRGEASRRGGHSACSHRGCHSGQSGQTRRAPSMLRSVQSQARLDEIDRMSGELTATIESRLSDPDLQEALVGLLEREHRDLLSFQVIKAIIKKHEADKRIVLRKIRNFTVDGEEADLITNTVMALGPEGVNHCLEADDHCPRCIGDLVEVVLACFQAQNKEWVENEFKTRNQLMCLDKMGKWVDKAKLEFAEKDKGGWNWETEDPVAGGKSANE